MTYLNIALAVFVIAQIADVISTNLALSRGHREANPVIRWVMDHTGKAWPIFKLLVSGAGAAAFYYAGLALPLLAFGVVVGLVALRNFKIALDK